LSIALFVADERIGNMEVSDVARMESREEAGVKDEEV
jgi:hypothetical protein